MKIILEKRIEKTMKNLEKNKMKPFYAKDKAEALEIVKGLMKKGQKVLSGGSMSLKECGVIDLMRSGDYEFFEQGTPGITPEQAKERVRQSYSCDHYLMSSNAITENGELYNVDGISNRVSALLFGPDSVIIVAGFNKIVADIPAAVERVKKIAAPANATRLGCVTPCTKTGECIDCSSVGRICCNYVVCAQQRQADRIKVILVGEPLGY